MATTRPVAPLSIGRYIVYDEIAAGGMASVHYGRLLGSSGFARTVAIKKLHSHFARDPEFRAMLLDEARLASRIRHPNVVSTLDVVARGDELLLVMEYVHGESLSSLLRLAHDAGGPPLPIVAALVSGMLHGLHAAHEARDEDGEPLHIVHRDVSPQNVMVGADGVARVLDFGVAKAAGRSQTTRDGQVKGKLAYMAIEQLRGGVIDRRTDVYAAGVVLWEALTGKRLFAGDNEGMTVTNILERPPQPPSTCVAGLPKEVDDITLRALARSPAKRFETARDMAIALETAVAIASPGRVAAWVESVVGETLARRTSVVGTIERDSRDRGGASMTAAENATSLLGDEASRVSIRTIGTGPEPSPPGDPATRSELSISVARAVFLPKRRRLWFVSAGAIAIVTALGFGLRHSPKPAGVRPSPPDAPVPATSGSSSAPAPATRASAGIVAASSPSAPSPPPLRRAPRRTDPPATAAPPPPPPPPATEPPAPSAKPCPLKPYTDDDGIVRFRREC